MKLFFGIIKCKLESSLSFCWFMTSVLKHNTNNVLTKGVF